MMSQAPPNINCNCCIIIIIIGHTLTFSNFQSKDFDTF